MTDKEKIRAEIERLKYQSATDSDRQAERGLQSASVASFGKEKACKELLSFIDSMQEEPVSEDLGKVGSLKSLEYYPEKKTTNKTSKGVFDANMPRRKAYLRGFKDGAHAHKELIANKPVSENLEDAAFDYAEACKYEGGEKFLCTEHFKAGAKWKEEQFENNRLIACDKQTEEEAEIERDFVMGIIKNEHRLPTFDDAIKYGMRLQKEQMMKDAVEAEVQWHDGFLLMYDEHEVEDLLLPGIKVGDKVRLAVIKED